MGQSLVKNYMHITFSTKHRVHLIHPPFESELHSYLAGICSNLDCQPIKIGGFTNHVHILCFLSKNIALASLIEKVKSHSSKWFKTLDPSLQKFYWQDGYGAFSVNPAEVDVVIAYIQNQHQHHRKKTFEDEYLAFLTKYRINYDERYIWD